MSLSGLVGSESNPVYNCFTLPETNSSPVKIGRAPKGNSVFQPPFFQVRAASFREGIQLIDRWFLESIDHPFKKKPLRFLVCKLIEIKK